MKSVIILANSPSADNLRKTTLTADPYAVKTKRDTSQEALRQDDQITDSKPVRAETLLRSSKLKRQLPEPVSFSRPIRHVAANFFDVLDGNDAFIRPASTACLISPETMDRASPASLIDPGMTYLERAARNVPSGPRVDSTRAIVPEGPFRQTSWVKRVSP